MTDELARLEREIAEEAATETVDWNCIRDSESIEGFYDSTQDDWNDDDVAKFFEKSVRYLELRGLLERHPERPELVRFK